MSFHSLKALLEEQRYFADVIVLQRRHPTFHCHLKLNPSPPIWGFILTFMDELQLELLLPKLKNTLM